jgi:hypothetical protein
VAAVTVGEGLGVAVEVALWLEDDETVGVGPEAVDDKLGESVCDSEGLLESVLDLLTVAEYSSLSDCDAERV